MPRHLPEKKLEDAELAVAYAQRVRAHHRRRSAPTSAQRIYDIQIALTRLRNAMKPLKSIMGTFPYGPQTDIAEQNRQTIKDAAAAIKRERMKLHKMLPAHLKNKPKKEQST